MYPPGSDDENPYREPKSPLSGTPARKTGFTRLQGLAIIAVATVLFIAARWYRQRAMMDRIRAALKKNAAGASGPASAP